MNKIINKALFYKEWINVRWVTLITIVMLIYFKVYGVVSELNQNETCLKQYGKVWTDRWFNNGIYIKSNYYVIMGFIIIILAVILFMGEKTSETQGFVASMPFTRKEILLNKWIVGVISILISFVVTYVLLSLLYVVNITRLDTSLNPYSDIVRWFFMDTFQYMFIFTFIMLAQGVMGNSIVSGILGGIIIEVPCAITAIVQQMFFNTSSIFLGKIQDWLNIYEYNVPSQMWFNTEPNSGKDMYRTFYYDNFGLKLLIFLILTSLFLYLAYVSYKKRNLEYNLRIIAFKNLEPVFILGFAVCLGLLVGVILGSQSITTFGIYAASFAVAGYFIARQLLKVFSSGK
jgi:ABC-type transport system involved in multi-copper enzyme maturation permease subunit